MVSKKAQLRYREYYGVKPATAKEVCGHIKEAVNRSEPFSLVRAGDIVTLLLNERPELIREGVFGFLGLPNPPPKKLLADLHCAIAEADVLGTTLFEGRTGIARQLQAYLSAHGIAPRSMTVPFIADELYAIGCLQEIVEAHSVVLIGRSAPLAAKRLQCDFMVLDNYEEVSAVEKNFPASRSIALVGAGVPGRILCRALRAKGKVAIDIGHVLDAFAYPHVWERSDPLFRRRAFKSAKLQDKKPLPMVKPKALPFMGPCIVVYSGIVKTGRGEASILMKDPKVQEELKRLTQEEIRPGTLNLRLRDPLFLTGGKAWRYGMLCPAILNGVPVLLNQRSFFPPDFITAISPHNLRELLDVVDGARVGIEIASTYLRA